MTKNTQQNQKPKVADALRNVVSVVKRLVDVHGVINHVGLVEELDLGLEDLLIGVKLPLLKKLEERENKMTVKIRGDSWG